MASTFNLLLDSQYSNITFSGEKSPSDVNYLVSLSLQHDYYSLYLQSVSLPNTEPAVMTGINDTLVFRENGGVVDFTVVIPEGSYNGNQYASVLQTAMNAVVGIANTYTVTYSTQTLKFTIYTTIPNTFSIRSNSTMLSEMGWAPSQLNSFSVTKTSNYVCDISGSHYVDIQANFNTKTIATGVNRNNILARIQLDVEKGKIVFFKQPIDSNTIICKRLDLEQLEFKIFNDKGRLFRLDPNQKVCMTFAIRPYQ